MLFWVQNAVSVKFIIYLPGYLWVGGGCIQVGPVASGGHVAAGGARMVRFHRRVHTKPHNKAVARVAQHVVDLGRGKVHPLHLHDAELGCLEDKGQQLFKNDINSLLLKGLSHQFESV